MAGEPTELEGGPRNARRAVLVVGALVAAALVVGAVALLHESSPVDAAGRRPAPSPAESARVRAAADRVYGSFAGTIEQRNAGLVILTYRRNGGLDACLDAAGYPEWDWSRVRQYAAPRDPLAYGTWIAEPHRSSQSQYLMAEQPRLVVDASLNREPAPGESAAIGRCLRTGPHRPAIPVDAKSLPRPVGRLTEQWNDMVLTVDRQGGSIEPYDACMDAADIPALVDTKLPASRLGEAISRLTPADSAIPSSPDDPKAKAPAWRDFLAYEKGITDADWQCRSAGYDALMAQLGPRIEEFAAQHAADIRTAREGWREIQAQAETLGYHGQVGPLGG